jgi:uncharacterized protein (TIGR02284 family)
VGRGSGELASRMQLVLEFARADRMQRCRRPVNPQEGEPIMPTATLAGKQSDPVDLLEELIKLDYDAIEAYDMAIERLDDAESQRQLTEFREDHRRHTQDLSRFLKEYGAKPPTGPDLKRFLTQGKVMLGSLRGDRAILKAMKSNEDQTNTAYERATEHHDLPMELQETLRKNLEDERRHRSWIERRMQQL